MKKSLSFLFLFTVGLVFSQDKRLEKIDSVVSSWYTNNEFNGNILIAEKGNIIFNKSYGKANEETGEMLNENSQFELASMSKQFTATAIMILKERNQLSLDDPITIYFPELVNYNKVTIKNLLNHTGGLQHFEEKYYEIKDKNLTINNEDVINFLKVTYPLFETNSQFEYCNTGYLLLGQIIEKVSGKKLNEFLSENIFEKLGMSRTKIVNGNIDFKMINNYAFGYVYDYKNDKWIQSDIHPDTEKYVRVYKILQRVNSTVIDLLKWRNSIDNYQILTKNSIEEMQTPNLLNNNMTTNYGYGLQIIVHEPTQKKIIQHGGDVPGYKLNLIKIPEDDITIIILTNRTYYEILFPYNTILNTLYHKKLMITQIKNLQYINEDKLPFFEGEYCSKNDTVQFKVYGKHLMFIDNGSIPIELKLKEEKVLFNNISRTEVLLKNDKKGYIKSITILSNGQKRRLKRKLKE